MTMSMLFENRSVFFAKFAASLHHHDLSIVCQAQEYLGAS